MAGGEEVEIPLKRETAENTELLLSSGTNFMVAFDNMLTLYDNTKFTPVASSDTKEKFEMSLIGLQFNFGLKFSFDIKINGEMKKEGETE